MTKIFSLWTIFCLTKNSPIFKSVLLKAVLYKALLYSLFDGSDIVVAVNVISGILRFVLWEAKVYMALLYSLFGGSDFVVVVCVDPNVHGLGVVNHGLTVN